MIKFLYPAIWISQFGADQEWSSFNNNPRFAGDVDGDGKSDVIGFANDGVYVSLSSGKNFEIAKPWVSNYGKLQGWVSYNQYPRLVADVNGDKKVDIVGFSHDQTVVSISNGSGFEEPSKWAQNYHIREGWTSFDLYPRCLGDINGDGKADIIGFGHEGVYISYSTGSSFSISRVLLKYFGVQSGWKSFNEAPRCAGDVNGDGKADLIGFDSKGVWVALSTGNGFLTPSLWSGWFGNSADAGYWTSFDEFPRYVSDVNNDGKVDIVGFGFAGIYVALSNGKSFDNPLLVMFNYGKVAAAGNWDSFEKYPRMVGDANGDGDIDIFGFGNAGVHISLMLSNKTAIASADLKAVGATGIACYSKSENECKDNNN